MCSDLISPHYILKKKLIQLCNKQRVKGKQKEQNAWNFFKVLSMQVFIN
jgi:hypothetical protein